MTTPAQSSPAEKVKSKPSIKECPNAHAAAPRLRLGHDFALVSGYQSYTAFPKTIVPAAHDRLLRKKQELLAPWFTPALLHQRTVLDLGANHAFFALWALLSGADSATAVDMDAQCQDIVQRTVQHVGYQNFHWVAGKIQEHRQPADVVLALALVHWVYSCTADFGSLDAVIGWLASISRHALIVEWIAPEDSAIANFKHTEFNPAVQREPYSYAAFLAALQKYFPSVTYLGHTTDTRSLFLARKTTGEVDLSGPLPLLESPEKLLSCRYLAPVGALHFWSAVYDLGDSILKQASFDLAAHEADILHLLAGPHFPRVLETATHAGYSTARIEKIRGQSLHAAAPSLAADATTFRNFVDACFDILDQLAAHNIRHRDIRPDNLMIRDAIPVLLDFGWATAPQFPCYAPGPFQGQPENIDLIGIAGILQLVGGDKFPQILPAVHRMSEPNPRFALTDRAQLRQLFHDVLSIEAPGAP